MNLKVIFLLCMAALVAAMPTTERPEDYDAATDAPELLTLLALAAAASAARPNYNYRWTVQDSDSRNDFGHQEARQLENTEGGYHVALPDGRLQQVAYRVNGDSGYLAEVSYKGEARFPDSDESFESSERRVFSAPKSRPSSASRSSSFFSHDSGESFENLFDSRESRERRVFSPKSRSSSSHSSSSSSSGSSFFSAPKASRASKESLEFPFTSRESRERLFDSKESRERLFDSRESRERLFDSRESRERLFDSRESREHFRAPKNSFLKAAESFEGYYY